MASANFASPLTAQSPGNIIYSATWNAEFANIKANCNPAGLAAYQDDIATKHSSLDPATGLAGSLAEEIEHLRFVIARLANTTNWDDVPDATLAAAVPIGTIIAHYDFNALATFDPDYWAFCDGSVLVDSSSILDGQTLPDLSGRYLVGFGSAIAVNEVQTITESNNSTGGTFTITFDGQTTAAIASGAGAGTVKAALEALADIGTGNISVTRAGSPRVYTLTFTGTLGGTNVAQVTATSSLTHGGGAVTLAIATTTAGSGGGIGSAAWATANVGNTSHEINIAHSHSTDIGSFTSWSSSPHNHLMLLAANTFSAGQQSGFAPSQLSGTVGSQTVHALRTDTDNENIWVNSSTTSSPASTTLVYTGDESAHTHSINPPSTTSTSSLSSTQSIQPQSVRVRFLIRKR